MAIEGPNDLERVLARRARDKAAAQARLSPIQQAIDADGQVTVWHLTTGERHRLWPVDAAELLERGVATLQAPEPPEPAPAPTDVAAETIPGTPGPPAAPCEKAAKVRSSKGKAKEGDSAVPQAEAPSIVPPT
jgi:hypothetical protein